MVKEISMTRKQFNRLMDALLDGIANDLTNELVRAAPKDKGGLQLSIRAVRVGRVIYIDMKDYWKYIEFGTAPHIIRPKGQANGGADALSFKVGGQQVLQKLLDIQVQDHNRLFVIRYVIKWVE